MAKRLSKTQAIFLYDLVHLAKPNAWQIPPCTHLAKRYKKSDRAVAGQLERLSKALGKGLKKEGRIWKVDDDYLCTEKETACYLTCLIVASKKDADVRVNKNSLHRSLLSQYPHLFSAQSLEGIFSAIVSTGYAEIVVASPENIRPTGQCLNQFIYLQQFSKHSKAGDLISRQ